LQISEASHKEVEETHGRVGSARINPSAAASP